MPDPIGYVDIRRHKIRLPIVRIPEHVLSPGLHGRHVEIYALLAFTAPTGSGKMIPGRYMIDAALEKGLITPGGTLVEPTSGGMGVAMAYCAKKHDIKVVAIVSDHLPKGKLIPLLRHGATVFTESEVSKLLGVSCGSLNSLELADLFAEQRGAVFLNQYHNPWNPESWQRKVALQVWGFLGDAMTEAFFAVGSTGTLRGLGEPFKKLRGDSSLKVIAARPYPTQEIAGTRDESKLKEVAPGWEAVCDAIESIDSRVARAFSQVLDLAGIPAGESSGAALAVAEHYYLDQLARGTLAERSVAFTVFQDTTIPYRSITSA